MARVNSTTKETGNNFNVANGTGARGSLKRLKIMVVLFCLYFYGQNAHQFCDKLPKLRAALGLRPK